MPGNEQRVGNQQCHDSIRAVLEIEGHLSGMIAEGASIDDVLTALVHVVEQSSDGMLGSVLLVEPDGHHFRLAAAPSLPSDYNALFQGLAIAEGVGSCGTAMHRGQMVIVSDIETDPLWANYRELALEHDLKACWSVPIKLQGRVVGSLAMYHRETREPDELDLQLLEAASRVAAGAIERERSRQPVPLLRHPEGELPRKRTILVVDDQGEFLEMIGTFLLGRGYQVLMANSAAEAIEIFRRNHAAVDFVLTDVRMPEMDGPKLIEIIMALKPGLKFLYMSADTGDLLPQSCNSVIPKPFGLLELERRIRELVD